MLFRKKLYVLIIAGLRFIKQMNLCELLAEEYYAMRFIYLPNMLFS